MNRNTPWNSATNIRNQQEPPRNHQGTTKELRCTKHEGTKTIEHGANYVKIRHSTNNDSSSNNDNNNNRDVPDHRDRGGEDDFALLRYLVRTPAISEHPTIVSAAKNQHLPTPSAFSEPPHLRPTLSAKVPHKGEKMTSQRE